MESGLVSTPVLPLLLCCFTLVQPDSESKREVGLTRVGRAPVRWLDKYLEKYSLSPGNIMLCGLIIRNMVLTWVWTIKAVLEFQRIT